MALEESLPRKERDEKASVKADTRGAHSIASAHKDMKGERILMIFKYIHSVSLLQIMILSYNNMGMLHIISCITAITQNQ